MRLIDEIEESDAHGGGLGRGEIGPVAAIIGPAPLGGMGERAVEFHAEPVGLVEIVQVPVAALVPDASLPTGRRQPVRAFHAADVPAFQPREYAFASIVE